MPAAVVRAPRQGWRCGSLQPRLEVAGQRAERGHWVGSTDATGRSPEAAPPGANTPMKALAVDVERNLRAPLIGIGHAATRLGLAKPEVSVAIRSGDTSSADRRLFA